MLNYNRDDINDGLASIIANNNQTVIHQSMPILTELMVRQQ